MNTNRDRLDEAIDIVVARMTNVEKDAALAARIASALPDRRLGLTWMLAGWAPRLAMLALAALAIPVVLLMLDDGSAGVGPARPGPHTAGVDPAKAGDLSVSVSAVEVSAVEAGIGGVPPVQVEPRGVSVESAFRRTATGTTIDTPDHERSLAPIDAPDALSLTALTPSELALEPAVVPAPLEIADLPLSSDFSPR